MTFLRFEYSIFTQRISFMIVLDIETTGLDPQRHSIIEIGAIDFSNPSIYFNGKCQIWSGAEVDLSALEINGFTPEEIQDNKIDSQMELLSNFKNWTEIIEDKTVAGQNVDFDMNFLIESYKRFGLNFNLGKRKVDQHSIVYAHFLKRNIKPPLKDGISDLSSDIIMNYVGLPAEPRPHRALNGARYETESLSRLIFGKGVFDEFADYAIPDYLQNI
jgi:DNA polymerase III epsilon subunit-like protein